MKNDSLSSFKFEISDDDILNKIKIRNPKIFEDNSNFKDYGMYFRTQSLSSDEAKLLLSGADFEDYLDINLNKKFCPHKKKKNI